MIKGNIIMMNALHLNSTPLNGKVEVQGDSASGGGGIVPIPPSIPKFILNASVQNGVVTATLDGEAISLPYEAYDGTEIMVSVTPNEGYEFNGWDDGNSSNPRRVVVSSNITLSASCKEIVKPLPTYILSSSVANGVVTATRNGVVVSLPYTANEGDTIVLSVQPNDGYEFNGWADGNTDNPRTITMNADVALSAQCVEVVVPPAKDYIQFEDAEVERVLMSKGVSSDGVGITKDDAAKVSTIERWFKGTAIGSFDEFKFFKGVSSVLGGYQNGAFYNCTNLKTISIPEDCKELQYYAFQNCTALGSVTGLEYVETMGLAVFDSCTSLVINELRMPNLKGTLRANVFTACTMTRAEDLGQITHIAETGYNKGIFPKMLEFLRLPDTLVDISNYAFQINTNLQIVICEAVNPPTAAVGIFNGSNCPIYVPDASLEAYKTATNWNTYADRIRPISEIEDYYISDALLMHLDGINKGNVEGEWQDLVGNNHFHAKADTPMPISLDNGWEFNGVDTMMTCDKSNKVSWSPTSADGTRTMEIVVEFTGTEDKSCCFTMGSAGFAFGRTSNKYILGATGAKAAMVNGNGLAPRKCVFTYVGNGVAYENGVLLSSASSDYWNADWTLGAASNGRYFKGKIHAIRIHNRVLVEEEILYNQRIDNKRFNLGLDI